MITYESMKMFLVTFAFESLVILIAVAFAVGTYIVCFVVLEVLRVLYEKRRSKLDDVGEE